MRHQRQEESVARQLPPTKSPEGGAALALPCGYRPDWPWNFRHSKVPPIVNNKALCKLAKGKL